MSPAPNVLCFMDVAIRSNSFPSRSEKIGTRFRRSAAPAAMRGTMPHCAGEAHDRRVLARLAEPRGRTVGVPGRGLRTRPAGLRSRRAPAPPRAGRVATRRCDRDHAFPPRPLGRSRAVDVRLDVRAGPRRRAASTVASAGREERAGPLRGEAGLRGHVRCLRPARVRRGRIVRGGRSDDHARTSAALPAADLRPAGDRRQDDARLLRRLCAEPTACRGRT